MDKHFSNAQRAEVLTQALPYIKRYNGEIVVALIEDEATVKTFYKEKDHIRLQPENSTMEPIIVKEVAIMGKVVGLFRKF